MGVLRVLLFCMVSVVCRVDFVLLWCLVVAAVVAVAVAVVFAFLLLF